MLLEEQARLAARKDIFLLLLLLLLEDGSGQSPASSCQCAFFVLVSWSSCAIANVPVGGARTFVGKDTVSGEGGRKKASLLCLSCDLPTDYSAHKVVFFLLFFFKL